MPSVADRAVALAKRMKAEAADLNARMASGELNEEQGRAEWENLTAGFDEEAKGIKKDKGPISGLKRLASQIPSIDELTGAAGIEEEADTAAQAALDTEERSRELNIERYGEAKDYIEPWIEDARMAREQQKIELGLAPGESGAYMETGGYQDMLSESQRSVEQAAASSGSLYSGARMKAAGEVGASVQNQFYNNYMNMLTNMADPSAATNLASLGVGQGATMGRQMIESQNIASDYQMGGAQAVQAGRADLFGGLIELGTGYMAGGGGGAPGAPGAPTGPTTISNQPYNQYGSYV